MTLAKQRRTRRSGRKSNAARQAAYGRRHLNEVDTIDSARLNMVVPVAAKRTLERLAKCYAVTQREILNRLLADAERIVTDGMRGRALRDYYDDAATD
jgi:hypothetical protein